jgi:hypothetical protein
MRQQGGDLKRACRCRRIRSSFRSPAGCSIFRLAFVRCLLHGSEDKINVLFSLRLRLLV